MYFFQLPRIPERLLMRRNGTMVSELLRRSGQTPDAADRDAQAMSEPGALTAAINWYRAIPLSNPRASTPKDLCANDVRVERPGHRVAPQGSP